MARRLVVEHHLVDLPQVEVVRLQPLQRLLQLLHRDLAVTPVGADLGHQEDLVAPVVDGFAHPGLALALVVVPGVVQKRDARVDGRMRQPRGGGVGLRKAKMPAAEGEQGDGDAGAAEGTGGDGHGGRVIQIADSRARVQDQTGGVGISGSDRHA